MYFCSRRRTKHRIQDVTEFMRRKPLNEILSNETLWGQNLLFLKSEIERDLTNE